MLTFSIPALANRDIDLAERFQCFGEKHANLAYGRHVRLNQNCRATRHFGGRGDVRRRLSP
jgi:hypothetical protein